MISKACTQDFYTIFFSTIKHKNFKMFRPIQHQDLKSLKTRTYKDKNGYALNVSS